MVNKEWTGERLEKHITNETMLEHLHRYAFAREFAKGKTVLDIACGEGYGCRLLAAEALQVTGVDIDEETIRRARQEYPDSSIHFLTGSITSIPCPDNSFDLVTCFETLEHITEQEQALKEISRVLKPEGLLFISTPDKEKYSDQNGNKNPFHQKELYQNEFRELLSRYFTHTCFYGQQSLTVSLLLPETDPSLHVLYTGEYASIVKKIPPAMFLVGMASNFPIQQPAGSLFYHQQAIADQMNAREKAVKQTITYRTGHYLLAPFKAIRALFRK